MKRIKQIIEALRVLSRTPSKAIAQAVANVMIDATNMAISGNAGASDEDRNLVSNILAAVVTVAEDMEKPAKAEGEAAK